MGIQIAFEYWTIWHSTPLRPFEYLTSLVFRSLYLDFLSRFSMHFIFAPSNNRLHFYCSNTSQSSVQIPTLLTPNPSRVSLKSVFTNRAFSCTYIKYFCVCVCEIAIVIQNQFLFTRHFRNKIKLFLRFEFSIVKDLS